MKEERLYIVGYMASGKTTFGKALADRLGWDFLDLDHEIERREGRSVSDIIGQDGEGRFRLLESMTLKSTSGLRKTVIACGGGTPCFRDNMEFMTLHGMTLWLVASPERMADRILQAGADSRPLAAGRKMGELSLFVTDHLRQRQPHYCKAQWRHSGEHLENRQEVEAAVDAFMKEHNLL